MIDLHSHILPEQDDGARNLQDSLAMARMAVDSGVTAMVATPHCVSDRSREVYGAWQLLREALEESGIPLRLLLGMEIFGTPDTLRLLQEGKMFTLNGSRYPLVEFSFCSDGSEESRILRSLCNAGYQPMVAHPERYRYIQENPRILNSWYRMGCLLQVNKGSLLGRFGHTAQVTAVELVERGFAAVVASDAHSPRMRTPWMEEVRRMLSETVSPRCARVLLEENPRKILKNEDVLPVAPEWFE